MNIRNFIGASVLAIGISSSPADASGMKNIIEVTQGALNAFWNANDCNTDKRYIRDLNGKLIADRCGNSPSSGHYQISQEENPQPNSPETPTVGGGGTDVTPTDPVDPVGPTDPGTGEF